MSTGSDLGDLPPVTVTCMQCGMQQCRGSVLLPDVKTLMQFAGFAQLTLALLPPGPHLFWLCFFAVLGVLVASTVRVATDMGTGIVTGRLQDSTCFYRGAILRRSCIPQRTLSVRDRMRAV